MGESEGGLDQLAERLQGGAQGMQKHLIPLGEMGVFRIINIRLNRKLKVESPIRS